MQSLGIASETLRLRLAPALGGSVLAFELHRGGVWLPLWRPTPPAPERANQCASYVLAPYSNRIRDGRFSFEGRSYQLRHVERDALHGDAHHRPWQIVETGATRVRLRLETRSFPDFDFPFPFSVEASYALEGVTLGARLVLTNQGASRMPAGLGFHPYFLRALDGGASEVELETKLGGIYPGEPPVPMLPTGPPRPLPPELDFSRSRPLEAVLDDCFSGWDGRARIAWPRSGVGATLEASARCRHLVIYSPAGQPFFAFEPVTNANDGFNLLARGGYDDGVVVLAPGEALEAGFTLRITS
ncbi:MAG TPA: aldose 1-epimerase [Myxococcota bacterium]|jgi:aldose 1-epimerase|nr:aldose 1-epimerase [Myxococcota bacterium]